MVIKTLILDNAASAVLFYFSKSGSAGQLPTLFFTSPTSGDKLQRSCRVTAIRPPNPTTCRVPKIKGFAV